MIVPRAGLVRALALLAPLLDARNSSETIQLGWCVHLVAAGGMLRVRVASKVADATIEVPCDGDLASTWTDGRIFRTCLQAIAGPVTLTTIPNPSGGPDALLVVDGGEMRFELHTVSAMMQGAKRPDAYGYEPDTEARPVRARLDNEPVSLPAAALLSLLNRTSYAIAPSDNRYHLNGLHLEWVTPSGLSASVIGDACSFAHLRAVATDGNRLVWTQTNDASGPAFPQKLLLPGSLCKLLGLAMRAFKATGAVEFRYVNESVQVTMPGVVIHSKMLVADFPDYRQIVPSEEAYTRTATFERDALLAACVCVGKLALDSNQTARFAFNAGALTVRAKALDFGASSARVLCPLVGDAVDTAFDLRFVVETLRAFPPGWVEVSLNKGMGPTRWRSVVDPSSEAFLMPVRVD